MLLVALMTATPAGARETGEDAGPASATAVGETRVTVAVREVPPFAMRDEAGNWVGLSVDLWQDVADLQNIEFEWREAGLGETIEGLRTGAVDVAIAAISVTGEREAFIDFSHPYYVTGLSLAYRTDGGGAWLATLRGFFSLEFLSAVGSLAIVLLVAGFAIWLFERKANAEQFGRGDVRRGLGDGFWWSAVTMTTVGYGDKAPRTLGGRVVALVWMFLSLIIIASFTASIAASLTANELTSDALRERPLSSLRVGVLDGSAAERFAESRGARVVPHETIAAAVQTLAAGGLDTVLHDAPILRHEVRRADLDVEVAERILVRDDYAFAFPEGSPIRNDVNLALLGVLFEPAWQDIRLRYLGETESAL
jgi:ABC-type amino acid transport substrate-binding protein